MESRWKKVLAGSAIALSGLFSAVAVGAQTGPQSSTTTTGETTADCSKVAARTGSDTNPGTEAAPFKTAQRLADSLAAGETGCLREGTYDELTGAYVLKLARPGAAGAPITIRSYPGERAKLVGIVWVTSSSGQIVLSELDIEGTGGQNTVAITADDVVVQDSDITNLSRGKSCFILGVSGYGRAARPIIRGNVLHQCGSPANNNKDHGIYANLTDDAVITDNVIWGHRTFAIQFYPDSQGALFARNVIDGTGGEIDGGVIFAGEGSQASRNNIVEKNIVAYTSSYNIEHYWGGTVGSGNVARNNCLWEGHPTNVSEQVGFTAHDNTVADPMFVDRANRDYRLQPESACAEVVR
jgi:Right handed beta helix region